MYTRLKDCPGCRGCNDDLSLATPVSTRAGKENMEVREQTNVEEEEDEEEEDEHDDDDDYEDVDDEAESEEDNENVAEAEHSAEENEGVDKIGNAADKGGESGVFGFSGGSAGFSFAALAQASSTKTFATDSSQPFHWQGAGKQVFGSSTTASADGDDDDAVAQGDDPHFEPIVPLPDLIDVKTGEEDETPVYSQRSKLFRFDKDAKQWKEKGIGEMKILKHKGNGKYRLLLRREQVHKLACNHHLTSDLVFTIMATSETSWCWTAQDYSENQPRMEQFALKFKNVDTANPVVWFHSAN
ncbi:hypothetical protein DPMN_165590 [Dreissena polymorpha]|uniref:RanBD1 domain-containing protein n=1 Tax=Dreissena polymorpha TaxID=45954 RepID=A0A9D4EZZ0_DREPO|nr:hypothetical protein DPMN_165590 [Dreissena polymorpha]